MNAIGSPTGTSAPAAWTISASVPDVERLHLDRRLVGLDLGDRVTALDRVADLLEPAGDHPGLHVVAELRHLDRDPGHPALRASVVRRSFYPGTPRTVRMSSRRFDAGTGGCHHQRDPIAAPIRRSPRAHHTHPTRSRHADDQPARCRDPPRLVRVDVAHPRLRGPCAGAVHERRDRWHDPSLPGPGSGLGRVDRGDAPGRRPDQHVPRARRGAGARDDPRDRVCRADGQGHRRLGRRRWLDAPDRLLEGQHRRQRDRRRRAPDRGRGRRRAPDAGQAQRRAELLR